MQKNYEQENQNRTEITEGRNFIYLVMFIKFLFRESKIVCTGMLSRVQTNSLPIF